MEKRLYALDVHKGVQHQQSGDIRIRKRSRVFSFEGRSPSDSASRIQVSVQTCRASLENGCARRLLASSSTRRISLLTHCFHENGSMGRKLLTLSVDNRCFLCPCYTCTSVPLISPQPLFQFPDASTPAVSALVRDLFWLYSGHQVCIDPIYLLLIAGERDIARFVWKLPSWCLIVSSC